MLVMIVDGDNDYIFLKEVYVVAPTVSPTGHLAIVKLRHCCRPSGWRKFFNEVGRKYVKLVLLLSKLIF